MHAYTLTLNNPKNLRFLRSAGIILLILVILYIGLRPISGKYFGDMSTYYRYFLNYQQGMEVVTNQDKLFHYYMKSLSYFVGSHGFFLIPMVLYTVQMFLVAKPFFKAYWFYGFLMFVVSFPFFSYGTNGIRNGLATSMFLRGLYYKDRKILMGIFFVLATLFHKTLLLPIIAYDCPHGPKNIISAESGILVEQYNKQMYAVSLEKLILDTELRETMGSNAKNNSQNFQVDKIMKKWLELFNNF
jgi:hypothetical protein